MLKKEVREFKRTLKQNVEVSDIPDHWKKGQEDLKIEISPAGQKEIESEAGDVKRTMKKI